MILVDFRSWTFDKSSGVLPSAQKELLQRDFDTLTRNIDFEILDLGNEKKISLSSLFFKKDEQIAVSPIKNITTYYDVIDNILEIEKKEVVDYTEAAEEDIYFYGANSLVVHAKSEIALCGINIKTDESIFEEYCEDFELTPFSFNLPENLLTSDIAVFAGNLLFICLDYITDKKLKKQLSGLLKSSAIKIISVTKEQVTHGALDLISINDKLIISKKAFNLFTEKQKEAISNLKKEVVDLPFLEKVDVKLRDVLL